VRTRIALATAIAVIVVPAVLFALFSSTSPASGQSAHVVASPHRAVRIDMKLTSYSKERKAAAQAAYYKAVTAQQEDAYLKQLAYLKKAAYLSAVAASYSPSAIPAAWVPTAMCEEEGRNDPYAGYFGILQWQGFDGYPTAGSAPVSVQLAWEAAHGQGPPDAPGQCHSY
jgi:hypothetical protein